MQTGLPGKKIMTAIGQRPTHKTVKIWYSKYAKIVSYISRFIVFKHICTYDVKV